MNNKYLLFLLFSYGVDVSKSHLFKKFTQDFILLLWGRGVCKFLLLSYFDGSVLVRNK